jgi:hypothetical protein
MHPTDKAARVAGARYLSLIVTAPVSLLYVPSKLYVRGNATATASIFVVMARYRLLSGVDATQASHMVVVAMVSAAAGFMNVLNNIAALILFRGGEFLGVFAKPQRDALAMLFLRLEHLSRRLMFLLMPIVRTGTLPASAINLVLFALMIVGLALSLWRQGNARIQNSLEVTS